MHFVQHALYRRFVRPATTDQPRAARTTPCHTKYEKLVDIHGLACYDWLMEHRYEQGFADGLADRDPARPFDDAYWLGWNDGNELHFQRQARARRNA